ncbi:pyruvate phosphate dikinase PEP/pyruvate-binding protein [Thermincola ferriacetica]|uniref:Pyruvate phosphate dikinase PEP/pyruvate-binding protein n=1 Tax=Thermincola ferriacetica TaxID=281456 RepID=A0A0L6W606_9FIRM|nr:PEP/pyruvate-binding domain-containing protein [Thermincola ferriacetica]KNZ70940.1 pyruvate phosphate dikinase PEP/pyruvate-binding protein [Thermincola ferriacetica]
MEQLVMDILEARKEHLPLVGGKGANLGDLARGLRVPPGFILTSLAYRKQMETTGLQRELLQILDNCDIFNMDRLNEASERIARLFDNLKLLPEIEEAFSKAYYQLAHGKDNFKVAVRSSATAEDLSDASFAGQQETFLNVKGLPEVLEAVKKCWASLWTPRAIHYRTQKGFNHAEVWMAVIVQEMIPAQVAGVMFTANPVTNIRNEILIEAASGLGEALVSGTVTGDSYVVEKNDVSCNIKSKTINNPSGIQLLTDFDIRELALNGIKIERFYEDYQDVEWAFHEGKFYFLQTRSITTLGDEVLVFPEINLKKLGYMQREVMKWVEERFPNPVHPIDGVVVKVLMMALFEAMENHGYKIDYIDWKKIDQGIFPEFFIAPKIRPGITRMVSYLRLFKILKTNPAAEWAKEQVYLLEMLERLQNRDISGLPLEIIIDYLTEAFNHLHFFIVMRYHYFMWNRIPSNVLDWILRFYFGREAQKIKENLLAGIPCITLDINEKLHKLAEFARARPAVVKTLMETNLAEAMKLLPHVEGGPAFLEEFEKFIKEYGERETDMGLGGIASPTWQDTPVVVLGIIRGITAELVGGSDRRRKNLEERVKSAEEKVYGRLSRGLAGFLGMPKFVARLVEHSRNFAVFRENSHYHITKGMHVFRILYLALGERLVVRGILKDKRDIFYLTYFEIKELVNTIFYGIEEIDTRSIYKKIEKRKIEQEKRLHRWKCRNMVEDSTRDTLRGVASSAGVVTGPARIIDDPKDFGRVKPGDVLVAPYTNPAWTPLFSVIAGLVVDSGGAASHAAIIAREYGIPAVMGVGNATQILKEGEIVTVDGTRGTVYRGR